MFWPSLEYIEIVDSFFLEIINQINQIFTKAFTITFYFYEYANGYFLFLL